LKGEGQNFVEELGKKVRGKKDGQIRGESMCGARIQNFGGKIT